MGMYRPKHVVFDRKIAVALDENLSASTARSLSLPIS